MANPMFPPHSIATPPKLRPQITLVPLIGILYFTVSGGAYGLEDLVRATGPGLSLGLLLITPLIWSVPISLMVAELSSAIPEEGGYYRWVTRGMGRFWGFQAAWWLWLWTFIDMSIYPVLFAEYLKSFWPGMSTAHRWGVALLVIWSAALLNLRGAKSVGMSTLMALAMVILPFACLVVLGFFQIQHNPWLPFLTSDKSLLVTLGLGLSVVMWNYQGWDNVATLCGEIVQPARTLPRALALTLPLVMLSYFFPVLIGLGTTNSAQWGTGYFPHLGRSIGGPALGWWVGLGALISAWCLFSSQLLYVSRLPFVLAEDRYLPKALTSLHPRWRTPWLSIILCAAIYSLFTRLSFDKLVVLDVCIYSIVLILELISLARLRRLEPDLPRPFKISGGRWGLILVCSLPALLILTNLVAVVFSPNTPGRDLAITLVALCSGPVVYFLAQRLHRKDSL